MSVRVPKELYLRDGRQVVLYWEVEDYMGRRSFDQRLKWSDKEGRSVDIQLIGVDIDRVYGVDRAFFYLKGETKIPVKFLVKDKEIELIANYYPESNEVRWFNENGREYRLHPISNGFWKDDFYAVYEEKKPE